MPRIIINNNTTCTDQQALEVVLAVIKEGKISNSGKDYCYCSTFKNPRVSSFSKRLKDGFSFTLVDYDGGLFKEAV